MKIQLPPWVAIVVVALVVLAVGFFAVKRVDSGTVGSVTLPGPSKAPQGDAPGGAPSK